MKKRISILFLAIIAFTGVFTPSLGCDNFKECSCRAMDTIGIWTSWSWGTCNGDCYNPTAGLAIQTSQVFFKKSITYVSSSTAASSCALSNNY